MILPLNPFKCKQVYLNMKLDVDFSSLTLAAAKMQGLDAYLTELRNVGSTYKDGLSLAKQYTIDNGGKVVEDGEQTKLTLLREEAVCFQPYSDINKFYFEL